jgi:hypothetical protein
MSKTDERVPFWGWSEEDGEDIGFWGWAPAAAAAATVGITRAASWALANTVKITRAGSWAIAALLKKTRAASWAIATYVGTARAASWAISLLVKIVVAISWSIIGVAKITRAASWAVANLRTRTRGVSWSIASKATITRAASWSIAHLVKITRSILWGIIAHLKITRAGSWAIANTLTKTRSISWAIASLAAKITRATSWSIAHLAKITRAISWEIHVGQLVGVVRDISWSIANRVKTTRSISWPIAALRKITRTISWAIANTVGIGGTGGGYLYNLFYNPRAHSDTTGEFLQWGGSNWVAADRVTSVPGVSLPSGADAAWRSGPMAGVGAVLTQNLYFLNSAGGPAFSTGDAFDFSCSAYVSDASPSDTEIFIKIDWYDVTDTLVGSSMIMETTLPSSAFVRFSGQAIVPAGAAKWCAYAMVNPLSSPWNQADNALLYVTLLRADKGTVGSAVGAYYDGDSSGWEWTGTSHNSVSESVAGGGGRQIIWAIAGLASATRSISWSIAGLLRKTRNISWAIANLGIAKITRVIEWAINFKIQVGPVKRHRHHNYEEDGDPRMRRAIDNEPGEEGDPRMKRAIDNDPFDPLA